MSFYGRMAATTQRLIQDKGAPVTLRRPKRTEYDPITGDDTEHPPQDLPTHGVAKRYRHDLIDGTRIRQGDKELTLTDEQVPQMGDTVIAADGTWAIVAIDPIQPAETVLGYRLQVRQ